MSSIDNIIKQLKKRKVFRSLAIYGGFVFVLLQVSSIIIPGLFLPEWSMTLIIVLVIIGFPIIAVLSWLYDITPTDNVESSPTEIPSPINVYALTGLVLTAIGIIFWVYIGVFEVTFGINEEVPSIAIIPFDNKGAKDDDFYAYSISSELISDVAEAGLIRVTGLKDIESLDYPTMKYDELSNKLLVRYIAYGSIWKIDSVFHVSMELYDTKTSKVLLSDSFQKEWNELAYIKGSLADNILKTLKVSTKQDITKAPTFNTESYEYYLRARYIYNKRESMNDTEIARGLLRKAIDLDPNLIKAKIILGMTYIQMGQHYDKAMGIFTSALKQAEYLGDKQVVGSCLNCIGAVYFYKGDLDKGIEYWNRSLKINEEIDNKHGMGDNINNIGTTYARKGDDDKALEYHQRSLKIRKEINHKWGIAYSYNNIGNFYDRTGNNNKALDYYNRALKIREEINDKLGIGRSLYSIGNNYYNNGDLERALDFIERSLKIFMNLGDKLEMISSQKSIAVVYSDKGDYVKALEYNEKALLLINEIELNDKEGMANTLTNIGIVYYKNGSYNKAVEYLDKSVSIQMLIDSTITLETASYLFLTKKIIGEEYNNEIIHTLIKNQEKIDDYINLILFELLEDSSYLETAYKQVQKKAANLEPDVRNKFLGYPIPFQIIDEWKKIIN